MKMSKKTFVSSIVATGLLCGAVGAYASDGVSVVQAYLNSTIKFTVNGAAWTPKDASGNKISPIIYNGSTYLPAKAVGEAMNATVLWNGTTKTVAITTTGSSTAGEPYNDVSTPAATAAPAATAKPTATPAAQQSSTSTSGLLTLPANFDLETSAVSEKYKSVALAFLHAYGEAVLTNSTSGLNTLVDKYMIDDIGDYNMQYKKTAKEYFTQVVASSRDTGDTATLKEYYGLLKIAPLSDLKYDDFSSKSDNKANLEYKIYLPGYIYSLSTTLKFHFDSETNSYILTGASFY